MKIIKYLDVIVLLVAVILMPSCTGSKNQKSITVHEFNGTYSGEYLNRIAFPIGGIGAGMFCLEGTGAISHMSVRNRPEVFNEPCMFAAISVKGMENGTKVLEGQVPGWKRFGQPGSGNGSTGSTYGLPRFMNAVFHARFPFAGVELRDDDIPMVVMIKGWSPFIPTDADNSSLPVGALEYSFTNTGKEALEAIFSYNSKNFMSQPGGKASIKDITGGFVLSEEGTSENPEKQGDFAIFTVEPGTVIDYCWFRGGWWDPMTMTWNTIQKGETRRMDPVEDDAPGASLYVPMTLKPGETKVIKLMMAWYVPNSNLRYGQDAEERRPISPDPNCSCKDSFYSPWYSSRFANIEDVVN
jgi:uncharacterized protein (DUF608 family)